jgi:hypothetical protein
VREAVPRNFEGRDLADEFGPVVSSAFIIFLHNVMQRDPDAKCVFGKTTAVTDDAKRHAHYHGSEELQFVGTEPLAAHAVGQIPKRFEGTKREDRGTMLSR